MAYEPPVNQPYPPAGQVLSPVPTERRRPNLTWAIPAGTVAALALFGVGWLSGSAYTDNGLNETPAAAAVPAAPAVDPYAGLDSGEIGIPEEDVVETTSAAGPVLSAADIKLTPKVTSKNCFGSAGCNVTVKVQMAYKGPTRPVTARPALRCYAATSASVGASRAARMAG